MSSRNITALATQWVAGRHVGASSKAIWAHMMGAGEPEYFGWSHPRDPDDMSRCIRLLTLIPEWRQRLTEMGVHSPEWAALVVRWDDIVNSMEEEVGWDWSKGRIAKTTYELMRNIIDAARR